MKSAIADTLRNSAPYICEFRAYASTAAETFPGNDYEISLVNLGSRDESLNLAIAWAQDNPEVTSADVFAHSVHRCGQHVSVEGTFRDQAALYSREASSWGKTQ